MKPDQVQSQLAPKLPGVRTNIQVTIASNLPHVGKTELAAYIAAQLKRICPDLDVIVESAEADLLMHQSALNGHPPKILPGTTVTIVDCNTLPVKVMLPAGGERTPIAEIETKPNEPLQ